MQDHSVSERKFITPHLITSNVSVETLASLDHSNAILGKQFLLRALDWSMIECFFSGGLASYVRKLDAMVIQVLAVLCWKDCQDGKWVFKLAHSYCSLSPLLCFSPVFWDKSSHTVTASWSGFGNGIDLLFGYVHVDGHTTYCQGCPTCLLMRSVYSIHVSFQGDWNSQGVSNQTCIGLAWLTRMHS